ncbi:unnamed protein product [Lampetra planeri]
MAVTDIAEDDLDEMMREEAEDVFYEDGRLAKGQMLKCESQTWAHRRGAGPGRAEPTSHGCGDITARTHTLVLV